MWKTLRRKRETISSQLAASLRRQPSISAAGTRGACPGPLRPLTSTATLTAVGPLKLRLSDDRGRSARGSNARASLEVRLAGRDPGAVPVAARIRGRLAQPTLQELAATQLEALVVDLGVAGLASFRERLLVQQVVEPDVRSRDHSEDVFLGLVQITGRLRAQLESTLHRLG